MPTYPESAAKKNHRAKAVVFLRHEGSGSDLDDPARRAFDLPGLDAGQLFIQALGHRADSGVAVEHMLNHGSATHRRAS